jgi:ferredoxin--NADP+ reductase
VKNYEITRKELITPNTFLMDIYAPRIAKKTLAGQFIILRTTKNGERIPLTSADVDREKGLVTIIFQMVGYSTKVLGNLKVGDCLHDFVGPLGRPSQLDHIKKVICIGGGVGTAVVYPAVKQLYENGAHVDVIVGARSKEYVILEDEIKKNSTNLYITTDDGSYGRKGFVTDQLKDLLDKNNDYDEVIAIGPMVMMKFVCMVTKNYNIKTMVSLNPLMVDGTGMCGCCRVTIGGETKYACIDGPDFNGHEVDFDELMIRQSTYKEEEQEHERRCGGIYHD